MKAQLSYYTVYLVCGNCHRPFWTHIPREQLVDETPNGGAREFECPFCGHKAGLRLYYSKAHKIISYKRYQDLLDEWEPSIRQTLKGSEE